jgi:transposase
MDVLGQDCLRVRAIAMDVVNDDAKGVFRRIEVLTGPTRRRRWSATDKDRIVAETMQPGATVTEVARRWQVCSQQVWGWRRDARVGGLMSSSEATISAEPSFVPMVAELAAATEDTIEPAPSRTTQVSAPIIEIKVAGAVVRVGAGTDWTLLRDVLRAVRTSVA